MEVGGLPVGDAGQDLLIDIAQYCLEVLALHRRGIGKRGFDLAGLHL